MIINEVSWECSGTCLRLSGVEGSKYSHGNPFSSFMRVSTDCNFSGRLEDSSANLEE